MEKQEEWMVMIGIMQKLHLFSRNILSRQRELTLTQSEMETLLFIYLKQNCVSPMEISQGMGTKREAVSRTLRGLIQKNLIKRTPSPQDERRFFLSLTSCGQEALDQNYQQMLRPLYRLKRQMGSSFPMLVHLIQEANLILSNDERETMV